MTKKQLGGGKCLFGLYLHSTVHIRIGTQTRQKAGGRSWCRSHGGVLLTGLLLEPYSACFLIEPRPTKPGMALPTMGLAHPHQILIIKMPYRLVYSRILWKHLLGWGFLLFDDSSLCQVDIKLTNTKTSAGTQAPLINVQLSMHTGKQTSEITEEPNSHLLISLCHSNESYLDSLHTLQVHTNSSDFVHL